MLRVTLCWKRPTVPMLRRQWWRRELPGGSLANFCGARRTGGWDRERVLRPSACVFFPTVILDKHWGEQRFAKMHVNLCHLWNCALASITVAPGLVYQGASIFFPRALSAEVKHHDADLGHPDPSIMTGGDRNDVTHSTPDDLHINHHVHKADVSPDSGCRWSTSTTL